MTNPAATKMKNSREEAPQKRSQKPEEKLPVGRAYSSPAAWLRFLIPAVLGVVADLYFKAWSFPDGVPKLVDGLQIPSGRHPAQLYNPSPIIDGILGFSTTVNHGGVFGSFQGAVHWFIPFSIIAMIVIVWVFLTSRKNHALVHITLGLIIAGAVGNFYDRIVFHGVRDMLRFYVNWYPYIFNIADVLLCIAVPLLMLRWLFVPDPPEPTISSSSQTE